MNESRKKFIEEYLISGNGTNAYMIAYSTNRENAKRRGSELLRNAQVREELSKRQDERARLVQWNAEDILQKIKDIANDPDSTRNEQLKALELGAKSIGMFRERIEHNGQVGIYLSNDVTDWSE